MTHGGMRVDLILMLFGVHKVLVNKPDVCDYLDCAVHIASVSEIIQS